MLGMFLKLFRALNSDVGPWQLAFAGALAMVIGLTPLWSLHNLFILFFAFIFRIHLATFFVFWGVFTVIAFLADPWFHQIGLYWLTLDSLESVWTGLYQNDVWRAFHFNHTITLGSFIVALVGFVPVAVLLRLGIVRYRATMMPWFNKLKVVQVIKSSRVYELYERFEG